MAGLETIVKSEVDEVKNSHIEDSKDLKKCVRCDKDYEDLHNNPFYCTECELVLWRPEYMDSREAYGLIEKYIK